MSSDPHWTEPGAHPVAPGIHRIPLPLPMDGLRAVNVYAIETGEGLTLIDGGWALEASRRALEEGLAGIDHKVSDITRFLVTHVHRDHYTQAVAVRREFGARVSLGLGDRATLDLLCGPMDSDPTVPQLQRAGASTLARAWTRAMGDRRPGPDDYGMPDTWLSTDHDIEVGDRTLRAVATPGHTQGHFVFADSAAGLLFSGDHVLPTITPSIGFEPAYAPLPLGDFLRSLAKVRELPDMTVLPAHGPAGHRSHARVDELVAHHDERLALCRDAVGSGLATAARVAEQLPWTRRRRRLRDLDVFNAALACLETLAHLELLAARDEVRRQVVEGVVHFYAEPATG